MNTDTLFASIWQGYNSTLVQGIDQVVSSLLSAMAVEIAGALGLFVIVCGALMTVSKLEWNTGLLYMVRAIVVAALLKGSAYHTYVVNTFMTTIPNWIAKAVGAGSGPTAFVQQFDALHSAVEHMSAGLLMQANGFLQFPTRVSINLATCACETALVICFVIYILAYVVTGLVVAAGVVLVATWIFNSTKHWGERWLGKLVSLMILNLFISVLLQIVMKQDSLYMQQAQAAMSGDLDQQVAVLWNVFNAFLIGTVVALALPLIASAIGGSAVMNVSNIIIAPVRIGAAGVNRLSSAAAGAVSGGGRRAAAGAREG